MGNPSRWYIAALVSLIPLILWLAFLAPAAISPSPARSPYIANRRLVSLNPFRNRGPEDAARRFFDAIKSGNCEAVSSVAPGVTLPNDASCEELHKIVSDSQHKGVLDQKPRDRIDKNNSSSLWFSDDGYGGNQVILTRHGDQWFVVGFW